MGLLRVLLLLAVRTRRALASPEGEDTASLSMNRSCGTRGAAAPHGPHSRVGRTRTRRKALRGGGKIYKGHGGLQGVVSKQCLKKPQKRPAARSGRRA